MFGQMGLSRYSASGVAPKELVASPGKSQGCSSSVVLEEAFLKEESRSLCLAQVLYPYQLSVLPLLCTKLVELVCNLLRLWWSDKAPKVHREVCYFHSSEGGLGMPSVEICQQTLRLKFLD